MKTISIRRAAGFVSLILTAVSVGADPLVDSWFTAASGKYARIYTTDANKAAGNSVTTWSNGPKTTTIAATP